MDVGGWLEKGMGVLREEASVGGFLKCSGCGGQEGDELFDLLGGEVGG